MNFNHEELMLMMLYNTGTRLGLVQELRLMQCYLMPDETALRELSENVIDPETENPHCCFTTGFTDCSSTPTGQRKLLRHDYQGHGVR